MLPDTMAIPKTIHKGPREDTIRIGPCLRAFPMLHVETPLTIIDGPHCIGVDSPAMCHGEPELADIPVAKAVCEYAIAAGVA